MKLYLTVGVAGTQKGIISLWDKPTVLDDEVTVELELTQRQINQLTINGVTPKNVQGAPK